MTASDGGVGCIGSLFGTSRATVGRPVMLAMNLDENSKQSLLDLPETGMGFQLIEASVWPQWTAQNPPLIDTSNPAISERRPRLVEFYFVAWSGRKSVWTLVRQLRGPHLRTWA
jgi:hypothetical protein